MICVPLCCLAAIPLMFMGLRSMSIAEKKKNDELKKMLERLNEN